MSENGPSNAKMKALEGALNKIRSDYGDESVIDMKEGPKKINSIPTGSLPLDIALGIGGIPEGRLIEIFGPESSGKTTLCYHMIAEVQKRGGVAAFVDTEHAMDAAYARALGVHIEDLIVSQPDSGEDALNIVEVLAASGAVALVVVDSVAALTPKAELEGLIGDSTVGALARMMSQACRKLRGVANRNNTTIVFTNQIREKIGVMFGSPETQPGGRALKFFSSQRLDIRRIETIKDGQDSIGNKVRVKVVKNKVAPPFKQAEFIISYGEGVDRLTTLIELDLAEKLGGVEKAGAFYTFTDGVDGDNKKQGMKKAKIYLQENPDVADKIEARAREALLPDRDAIAAAAQASAEEAAEIRNGGEAETEEAVTS